MLFLSHSVIAQFGPLKNLSIEEESKLMEYNSKCVHRDKYSPTQRKLLYPFNQTALISLISFQDTISEFSSHLPVKKGILDSGMVKEEIKLSKTDIDKLTDLLFNYGYRSKKYGVIIDRMACYDPHNAILFFNNERKVIAYIEICFDCLGMKFSSKKINTGENCTEKFSMLKDFFTSKGIKFVSIDHTDEL
ncbi:hypothetical protein EZ456_21765 [Pedobacter psychrodurus]|uniref:Uncharacterized protein n=1 Tax=Pedobacter psychrodurus TaxID=2530456 RepID=A0A4R0PKM5_9SPHI|nr:hypothetical protein [Pedobacter psychrodurus]TCD18331.1 hypothetical protein EZ456_21765 [Pedobacter psychrodurus]